MNVPKHFVKTTMVYTNILLRNAIENNEVTMRASSCKNNHKAATIN